MTHTPVAGENNKIHFTVNQMGEEHNMSMEQIISFYLKKIKRFYEMSDILNNEFVISVPSYFTNVERQAIIDACDIAGIKCMRVINESTAIVYNYGFFRKGDLDQEKERIVAFVDLGHSKTTVTIAGFKKGEARIIIHNSDRNLGGRDMDNAVIDVIGGEFAKKHGNDPRKNARCRVRLFEACEKARKLLSSDTESSINVEYLLDEEDLNRKLNREEFEKINEKTFARFEGLLKDTLKKASLSPE